MWMRSFIRISNCQTALSDRIVDRESDRRLGGVYLRNASVPRHQGIFGPIVLMSLGDKNVFVSGAERNDKIHAVVLFTLRDAIVQRLNVGSFFTSRSRVSDIRVQIVGCRETPPPV